LNERIYLNRLLCLYFRYSQSCGHLGALLFKVEDIIESGHSQLPDDLTCTEMPSYWAGP